MAQACVLVVDSDQAIRQFIRQTLGAKDYEVIEMDNAEAGLAVLRSPKGQQKVDVVLCHQQAPAQNGTEAVMKMLAHRPVVPVVVLADHPDVNYAAFMFRQGVVDYLVKPVLANVLLDVVRHAVTLRVHTY